ncbi:seipin [Phtheirospermum japonicum]|uniref:Seipin n=1 Tax=Phtheirospermum japonicum TaxID=374723 RepID=A0A830CPI4_9LAMI|nr:seipin [Phtheirospermum japonicum]
MEDSKSSAQNYVDEEFHDALDDFPFYDCIETFPEPIESNGDVSISSENPNSSPVDKDIPRPGIRRRRSHSHYKSSGADSSVNLENYLRERKSKLTRKIKDCSIEFEKTPAPLEVKRSSEYPEISPSVDNDEKSEEHSTITNANGNAGEDLARDESNPREIEDPNSSLLFTLAGIVVMVEEPIRMTRSLNFDYKEKSPVAYVPIMTGPELIHDMYLGEKPEIGKDSGSRVIPANHKLKVTVSLTLPESEYNQNLGIFQVRVDFLSSDGKTLARSRRPCMLQFKSQPIRLALTMLKVAPILTGYTSETQNLEINFRGFTEGETPTACLSVVIEQRAEFSPGGGIPEIYDASLTLESELPLLKNVLWFWKKTLFVWISMVIFTMELFFALLCCKPIVIPRIRLREAGNRDASRNDRSG